MTSPDDGDFVPGGEYRGATLELWDNPEDFSIAVGTPFTVWYGEDVGEGAVTALTSDP